MPDPETQLEYHHRQEIDRIADEFESEFRNGQRPSIEAYLEKQPELLRSQLFKELLALDIEFRLAANDQPTTQEYNNRFPQLRDVVEKVFSAVDVYLTTKLDSSIEVASEESIPDQLGRYVIKRQLGRGGFGVVYLAHDPQLERLVALKVPRRESFKTEQQVASFIQEARTAAKLKHPLLVAVHDVQEVNGLPYIIQEYIDGENLADWAIKKQPSFQQIARILVGITEALGYAHQQGLTHCDLKLANVLMDQLGQPHVADFGLAIHQDVRSRHKGERFGTPAMMAPEQVRGEGHRLDGRTDIWALGVMFYELLVSQRPFTANTLNELFNEIETLDPRPPRQIDRKVPRELERVCLKCLSKRRTDRYSTTDDLREDLELWLAQETTVETPRSSIVLASTMPIPDSDSASKPPAKIIPKGLRSFDAEDADFFLQLLPGPRDRDDLPESIRFWKTKIEEADADKTFSVGLIYGPSGCGKSSLVKAGLLPRLSDGVLPIYVEATAADTEVRILKQLRKHLPRFSEGISLPDAFADLRTTGAGRQRKLLVVIDQFEQWLHAKKEETNTDLVQALRQCDGGRVQCIVMVRDDFWMAVTRFMRELEIRLIEGQNSAAVDLFPIRHAEKVLAAFGRAFGILPDNLIELNKEQKSFITQSVAGLAEEGKVNCVRLALFAEMVKGKAWTPATLKEVGGTKGIGVTFLEETFSASKSPPEHRYHQKAARAVLKDLLPDSGTDIKGTMRSYAELLESSGYGNRPRDFDDLVHILDSEIRLIMPTDPDGKELNHDTVKRTQTGQRYFQLTHDYLVHSLREWLTRKQKETRQGRSELRLFDASATWNSKPENRFLPSLLEWLSIRTFTDSKRWTDPQRAMMRSASRVHGLTWGGGLGALLVIGFVIQFWVSAERWKNLKEYTRVAADSLQNNLGSSIPVNIKELRKLPKELALGELNMRFESAANPRHKLALAFALADFGRVETEYMVSRIDDIEETDTGNLVAALKFDRDKATAALKIESEKCLDKAFWRRKAKLAIASLALNSAEIANDMCTYENRPDPEQRTLFIDEFPSWELDLGSLVSTARGTNSSALRSGICLAVGSIPSDRVSEANQQLWKTLATQWYVEKGDTSTHGAASWLLRQWRFSLPEISKQNEIMPQRDWFVNSVGSTMLRIRPVPRDVNLVDPIELYRQQLIYLENVSASEMEMPENRETRAIAYFYTGKTEEALKDLDSLLRYSVIDGIYLQPTLLPYRSLALAKLGRADEARESLVTYQGPNAPKFKRANVEIQVSAWLGDTEAASRQLEAAMKDYSADLSGLYDLASVAAVCAQATADRETVVSTQFAEKAFELLSRSHNLGYRQLDHLVQDPDIAFLHRDPRLVALLRKWYTLDDEYLVADCEVMRGQFEQFVLDEKFPNIDKPEKWPGFERNISPTAAHPAQNVSWYDAVKYCNWLSVKEGRSPYFRRTGAKEKLWEGEFDSWEEIPSATGYRLLRELEWEYACRAGTQTAFSSGNDENLLVKYFQMSPPRSTSIAGSKLPNAWGLHDMHGNVSEWCFEKYDSRGSNRVSRGGSWGDLAASCRSPSRYSFAPTMRNNFMGFRLALSPSNEFGVKVAEPVGGGTEGATAEQRPEMP